MHEREKNSSLKTINMSILVFDGEQYQVIIIFYAFKFFCYATIMTLFSFHSNYYLLQVLQLCHTHNQLFGKTRIIFLTKIDEPSWANNYKERSGTYTTSVVNHRKISKGFWPRNFVRVESYQYGNNFVIVELCVEFQEIFMVDTPSICIHSETTRDICRDRSLL